MTESTVTKSAAELQQLVRQVLEAAGASASNAEIVAQHVVAANLSGVDTHGVWQVPRYVGAIKSGEIVPTASPAVVKETATSGLVTGNWTFGQVAARFAMEVAIGKAAAQGVAVVGLVQSHHTGRLGALPDPGRAPRAHAAPGASARRVAARGAAALRR